MKKGFLVLLLVAITLTGVFANGSSESASDTIKIAYVGPMTGDQAEYGITMSNAVQIAIDDINAAGGALGK